MCLMSRMTAKVMAYGRHVEQVYQPIFLGCAWGCMQARNSKGSAVVLSLVGVAAVTPQPLVQDEHRGQASILQASGMATTRRVLAPLSSQVPQGTHQARAQLRFASWGKTDCWHSPPTRRSLLSTMNARSWLSATQAKHMPAVAPAVEP